MTRALVFDLDDTLLSAAKTVSVANRAALFEAHEAGFALVVATSRPIRSIHRFLDNELIKRMILISQNGSVGHFPGRHHEPEIYGRIGETSAQVIERVEWAGEPVTYSVETDGLHFGSSYQWSEEELHRYHAATPDMVRPIDQLEIESITKVAVDGHGERIPKTLALAEHFPMLRFIPGEDGTFANIVPAAVDKSTTLKRVASSERFDLANSFAFGDDIPDVEMFREVGTGVAMENARPEVKRAADLTIGHHESDAIADFLRRVVLE